MVAQLFNNSECKRKGQHLADLRFVENRMAETSTDNRVILYFNSASDGRIGKEVGDEIVDITAKEARAHWESGNVKDCNVAFRRLVQYDFDAKAALLSYSG